MKKALTLLLVFSLLALPLVGCESTPVTPDYTDVASFKADLNAGKDLTGEIVQFTVDEIVPDSFFGYNLQSGEHLNFCSTSNPKVSVGDTVTVEVKEVTSMLGSYIISYTMK